MNIISYAIGLNSGGSKEPVLESISITANGTYTPDAGIDGYNSVSVNVPQDGAPTAEELTLTGNCSYAFYGGAFDWIINKYGNLITTNNITQRDYMFCYTTVSSIPFTLNCADNPTNSDNIDTAMFLGAKNLQVAPNITGYLRNVSSMFDGCVELHAIPEYDINFDRLHANKYGSIIRIFKDCYKLRSIPTNFLKQLYNLTEYNYNSCYYYTFENCYYLDEIVGVPVSPITFTSNCFKNTFNSCKRVKNIIFDTDNGNAKTANWKSQTIDLSQNGGVGHSAGYSLDTIGKDDGYRLTEATQITSLNYDTLKDNPDSWATTKEYSRYNHDSAVATINSLPDTSAYLVANGGTNTIKFKGASGSATDGGAINTLTEEEIAVATARGWTVSFT